MPPSPSPAKPKGADVGDFWLTAGLAMVFALIFSGVTVFVFGWFGLLPGVRKRFRRPSRTMNDATSQTINWAPRESIKEE
jgi:hypothetical protein